MGPIRCYEDVHGFLPGFVTRVLYVLQTGVRGVLLLVLDSCRNPFFKGDALIKGLLCSKTQALH